MSGWVPKTRINTKTGEILHIFQIADKWILKNGGNEVCTSTYYPDVHRVYDRYEFMGDNS